MTEKCPKCGSELISISLVNGQVDKYSCRKCAAEWYPNRIVEAVKQPLSKAKKAVVATIKPKVRPRRK